MKKNNEDIGGPPILVLEYDTRGWPRGQAFEFDREALRPTYELRRPDGTDGHWFRSQIQLVDSLMLARNNGDGGHVLIRTPRHIESNPGRYLKLQVFSAPGGNLTSGDRTMALDPGSVFLIDQSRPYIQTMPSGQNLTFFLPHARTNYDPSATPAVMRFGRGTPEGQFLSYAMRMVFRLSGGAAGADGSGLAFALCGSVERLLNSHASRTDRSVASPTVRLDAVRQVIDLNLANPEFGPADVLAKVATSRATLYRDFASMGGLMAYIQSRRLEKAYHVLSMSPRHRGAVIRAAQSAGFSSPAHFSRAFRDKYRAAPSDILGQWRIEVGDRELSGEPPPFVKPDALRALYTWSFATTAAGQGSPCQVGAM